MKHKNLLKMISKVLLVFGVFVIQDVLALSVTYAGIGTFNSRDFFDAKYRADTLLYLPQSPALIGPTFYLYTPSNRDSAYILQFNSSQSINGSQFNASLETKILVHGFLDSVVLGKWMNEMKDRYLEYEDVNVIVVDWSRGNGQPYGQATVNTRVIGAMIAIEIQALNRTTNATFESFQIIGHSLGAHIGGYAGKFLNGTLGRITGLDAAGPSFEGIVIEGRLWCSDALFVDGIHTDSTGAGCYGMNATYGHVDFYPNNGSNQPGCTIERGPSITDPIRSILIPCSHQRSVDFYLDSLNRSNPLPKAYQCENYQSYLNGNCTDCGANGEKCALLGPRAVEYQNFSTVCPTNGIRFFLVTDNGRPLLSKYQYDFSFNSSTGSSILIARLVFTQITVYDSNGNSDSLNVDTKSLLGYGLAGVLSVDPVNLEQITVGGLLITSEVDSIRVVGFTTSASSPESPALIMKFCKGASSGTFVKC